MSDKEPLSSCHVRARPNSVVEYPAVETMLISGMDADHQGLDRIFAHTRWKLVHVETLTEALKQLDDHSVGVVICCETVRDGCWKDLLRETDDHGITSKVMLAAANPTKQMWSVALQCGADSIISIPFASQDVIRTIADAWYRWWYHQARSARLGIDLAAFAKTEVKSQAMVCGVSEVRGTDPPVKKPPHRELGFRIGSRRVSSDR